MTADDKGNVFVGGQMGADLNVNGTTILSDGGNSDFFIAKYGTASCGTVVPLQLLTFTAKWLSSSLSTGEGRGAALLQWTTAQELNTSHFEIERSIDGREFSKIGTVKANSTTQSNTYKFSDAVAPNSPLWGAGGLFYRLKMVDKDGQFTYSPIRSLTINHSSLGIAVYPNPAKDVVHIAGSNMVQLTLTDQTGRNLFTRQCANSSLETIPVKRFGRGVYVLRVTDTKGNIHIAKVVVE